MKLRQVITQTVHAPVRKKFKLIRKSLEKKNQRKQISISYPKIYTYKLGGTICINCIYMETT